MKIIQINLQHSKAASANLVYLMEDRQIDIALIQEPWIAGGRIKGLHSKELTLYKTTNVGINSSIRACIVARKQINLFLLSAYSCLDQTTVKLDRAGLPPLVLASCYMPGDGIEGPPAEMTKQLITRAALEKWDAVVGCDANAHHLQWGSTDINNRGELLFEFIIENNILVANRGNEPTFVTKTRKEVLDVTLLNNSDTIFIDQWKVLKEESFSDHKLIEFLIPDTPDPRKPFRNLRRTNWDIFNREVETEIRKLNTDALQEPEIIEKATDSFTEILGKAFEKGCPLKLGGQGKKKPPWWTTELGNIRKETRRLFNVAKRTRTDSDWETYKSSQKKFKMETQRAKRSSWRNFCSQIESTNESARLRKILAKGPIVLGSLKEPNGHWTESCSETLQLLVNAHFPGCTSNGYNNQQVELCIENTIPTELITEERIKWAINSFSPYKSPGLDGVFPMMLQKCEDHVIPHLKNIFLSSLKLGYVPKTWREVKVVFIPKAGKPSHTTAKDFRPISLTSFLLKTFERLIDIYIRNALSPEVISPAQHAYTKGKSVETALHSVVSTIEKTLKVKEYTLAAFLDIEGAFNNVQNEAVEEALVNLNVNYTIIRWIMFMLKNRQINSELGGSRIKVSTSRGTPQGGVLSPLLWTLVMNTVLVRLRYSGVKVIAYADDLALLATGKFPSTISEQIENALSVVNTWTRNCGLAVNPQKTELVLFTNKRKIPTFKIPFIEGTQLKISDHARYLGVILDKKLNWSRNVKERTNKAMFALYSCNRIFGKTWGPSPKIIRWMFTAIVRPVLTYGNVVWWNALDKVTNLKLMTKVQRMACIGITGAMRSTPTAGLEAILNLTPLDLFVQESAAKSALRLSQTGSWKHNTTGHAQILQKYTGSTVCTDYMTPRLDFHKPFTIAFPSREDWQTKEPATCESMIAIYTDGSKMDTGVGAGFFSETLRLAGSFRLPNYSSVFQAEVLAVTKAARQVSMMAIPQADITFFIDSQAAIKAISAIEIKSKLVTCCREELRVLGTQHNIRLCWVPGHSGVPGNESADELARIGSTLDLNQADSTVQVPLCNLKRVIESKVLALTNKRWNSLDTCVITRKLWPSFNKQKTDNIIKLGKRSLSVLVSVTTGHNQLGYHKKKMRLSMDDLCRGCGDEEIHEDTPHYLCHCPALCHLRNRLLGRHFFNDLEELSETTSSSMLKFI